MGLKDLNCPHFFLIFSADGSGSGLLDTSMKTLIVVSSDGKCSWFCPMIFKSECTIDITWFPVDRQSCPLKFGLWTYNGLRVNLTNLRDSADLSGYIPSGEFNLDGVPVQKNTQYYACCPGVPYPDVTIHVNLIRRTKFYIMNIIWPGLLIALLAAITFLLPPESGERIGLGITNLLAMMVFLLLISESIPPTSDAISFASNFFTTIVVLSAVALIVSCVAIKLQYYSGSDTSKISSFVRVFINKFLATVLCVNCCESKENRKRKKSSELAAYGLDNLGTNGLRHDSVINLRMIQKKPGEVTNEDNRLRVKSVRQNPDEAAIAHGMKRIVKKLDDMEGEDECKAEYMKAIKVVDRLCAVLFLIGLIVACVVLFVTAPRFWVP